ncbi:MULTISPECIES: type II secretion system protein [Ruminococcus]|uniref:Prepilin-type N-terminal cleavage/methylation domain-containing protein n=1 Tax=Ruminococcus flavefaciens TaxID=1265 RepID=A0A1M7M6S0_RUMFL|nr:MULTISPECIES: type II secretion system protein [Ruminococcus]MCR4795438.1 type II secretion system GspH family protein [Ruminococcus sp.]SHM86339.1 prepilin-type N-terminal cleavage/methylation domain-containing protein [Ruminococcus flavefaciens]
MNEHESRKKTNGFTLIELIVVICIISVLAAMLVPSIMGYVELARNRADVSAADVICKAIQVECAMDTDRIEYFTKNPWRAGVNKDGTKYEADDHGYVYVDQNEVRVSSYAIAKILEENGYIKSAGKNTGEIKEYKFKKDQCKGLICKSRKKWYRYQINIIYRNGEVDFTFSANSKDGERYNTSGQSSGTNLHDQRASEIFAGMIGGTADDIVSLPSL